MTATAFGKPLDILRDGAVAQMGFASRPLPLAGTEIDIVINAGLAITRLTRKFRNAEAEPIEVLMTFPVGFHSVVTGLTARIGDRRLVGKSQEKNQARETYEEAIERGELAVLHEEPLRGLNVLSIAPLPPGIEVEVCAEIVTPLSPLSHGLFLRLPMTIGAVYGDSPLQPADDVLLQAGLSSPATLAVRTDHGTPKLADGRVLGAEPLAIQLDEAIEITVEGGVLGTIRGHAANGAAVDIALSRMPAASEPLSCAILFDKSGSTNGRFPRSDVSIWHAMRNGLRNAISSLSEQDEAAIWQFDTVARHLGSARGANRVAAIIEAIEQPDGGTQLIDAVIAASRLGARQILVITDGQTWATQAPQEIQACVHAVLVGSGSLDAGVGHLATQTGGQVFYASGVDAARAINASFDAIRRGSTRTRGAIVNGWPKDVTCSRAGVELRLYWADAEAGVMETDAAGRFAAALALPLIEDEKTAAQFAAAHGLCCHLTSLILVDPETKSEPGLPHTIRQPLVERRDAAPMAMETHYFRALDASASPSMREGIYPARRSSKPEKRELLNLSLNWMTSSIEWSDADAFLRGDFSTLPTDLVRILDSWAAKTEVKKVAGELGLPALLVALALYARKKGVPDRNARRLVKRVLGSVEPCILSAVMHLTDYD